MAFCCCAEPILKCVVAVAATTTMRRLFQLALVLVLPLASGQVNTALNCNVTVPGGPVLNGRCQFPFRSGGRQFDRCTTSGEGDLRPWCPTKLDPDGSHSAASNDWGYCDRSCPFLDATGQLTSTEKPSKVMVAGRSVNALLINNRTFFVPERQTTTTSNPIPHPLRSAILPESGPTSAGGAGPASLSGAWLPRADRGECGVHTNVGFILGGRQAVRGEFPFIALLGYAGGRAGRGRTEYKCGGTLLNRRYVLTAAHCHLPQEPGFRVIEVVLGEFDVAMEPDCVGCRPAQRIRPEYIIRHDDYGAPTSVKGEADIALIRLERPAVTLLEDPLSIVMPVCLDLDLNLNLNLNGRESAWVAGWGKTTNRALKTTDFPELGVSERTLQKLLVPLVDLDACRAHFSQLTDNMICAGGEFDRDSCSGDSGGPLVIEEDRGSPLRLIGVVSSGSKDCGIGKAGIYTKVEAYMDWIIRNLKP